MGKRTIFYSTREIVKMMQALVIERYYNLKKENPIRNECS
jgi:hypothetical protein